MRPKVRVLGGSHPQLGPEPIKPFQPAAALSTYPLVHSLLHLLCKYTSHRPFVLKNHLYSTIRPGLANAIMRSHLLL